MFIIKLWYDRNHLYVVLFGRKKIKQHHNLSFAFKSCETKKPKKGQMNYHSNMKNPCADMTKGSLQRIQSWKILTLKKWGGNDL